MTEQENIMSRTNPLAVKFLEKALFSFDKRQKSDVGRSMVGPAAKKSMQQKYKKCQTALYDTALISFCIFKLWIALTFTST